MPKLDRLNVSLVVELLCLGRIVLSIDGCFKSKADAQHLRDARVPPKYDGRERKRGRELSELFGFTLRKNHDNKAKEFARSTNAKPALPGAGFEHKQFPVSDSKPNYFASIAVSRNTTCLSPRPVASIFTIPPGTSSLA